MATTSTSSTTTATRSTSTTTTEEIFYCSDSDLIAEKPRILSLGVATWISKIREATAIINRTIEARWYRSAAANFDFDFREVPFSPKLLSRADSQLNRLCVYKALQLAYQFLSKDSVEPDAFERHAKNYEGLYKTELSDVLAVGLDYDWNTSGGLSYEETYTASYRRLKRS
jgi:hypothetical protein